MRNKEIAFAYAYAWIMYGGTRLVSAFVRGCTFEMGREFARERLRLVGDRWITINGTHVETKGGQLMGRVGRRIEEGDSDRGTGETANQKAHRPRLTTVSVRKALGEKSYRGAHRVLKGASPAIRSVWNTLEQKLKVAKPTLSERATAYTDTNGYMHFNVKKLAMGDLFNRPYATLFHEGGHAIDRLLATAGRDHFSAVYHDGELAQTAKREVRETRKRYEGLVGEALKEGLKAWKNDAPTPSGVVTEQAFGVTKQILMELSGAEAYLNEKSEVVRNAIVQLRGAGPKDTQKYKNILKECKSSIARDVLGKSLESGGKLELASVSDIFDGGSRGKIHGETSHGESYWTEKRNGDKLSDEEIRERFGTEVFASLFSAHAINGEDLSGLKEWLPQTCAVFARMMLDVQEIVERRYG